MFRRAGQVHHEIGSQGGVLGVLRYRQLPTSQRRRVPAAGAAFGQRDHADLVLDGTVGAVGEIPRVRPVAHEDRVARLEYAARFFFTVVQHALGRNRVDPPCRHFQSRDRARIVDRHLAGRIDDRAAVVARDPFERIAG